MSESARPAAHPVRFRFRPRVAMLREDELKRFRVRIRHALRAAIGLGGAFELGWASGPSPRVELRSLGTRAADWVGCVLIGCYEPEQWTLSPDASGMSVGPPRRWFGSPVDARGAAFRPLDLGGPWSEAVLLGLAGIAEPARVTWELRPPDASRGRTATEPRSELDPTPQPLGYRLRPATEPERALRDLFARRALGPLWSVRLTLEAPAAAGDGLPPLGRLVGSSSQLPGANGVRFSPERRVFRPAPAPFELSEEEVAALLPDPASRLAVPLSEQLEHRSEILLGRSASGLVITLPVDAREGRHLAIVGESGMGKSSMLVRIGVAAARRHGVILLDPVGDTARRFLAALSESRRSETVFVSAVDSPVSVNALGGLGSAPSGAPGGDRALHDLVAAIRRVREGRYLEAPFWGPRIEETVARALSAAAQIPGGTLVEAERLLTRRGEPIRGVPVDARPAVRALQELAADRPEEVEGARRLLAEIVRSESVRALLADPRSTTTIDALSAPGRILVVSGDAERVGESAARYLTSIYLALLWSSLVARPHPQKTFVLLDEAQGFAHQAASEMLRLGRRWNLHAVLATQSLRSLPEEVRESLLTNAADLAVFRGSPDDAREIARWTSSVSAESLLSLPRGHATIFVGKGAFSVTVRTAPPPRGVAESRAIAEVVAASERFRSGSSVPPSRQTSAPSSVVTRRDLLLVLWAGAAQCPSESALRVPVDALRRELDPLGQRVRELGGELGRAGALRERFIDPSGPAWLVEASAIRALVPDPPSDDEARTARERWSRLAERAE